MKHLFRFNENSEEFDLDFAMSKIKEEYSDDRVCQLFDEEVLNWVDEGWEEDFESEYDWYIDHNNGEAQDVIIESIIDWYKSNYSLPESQYSDLFDDIKNNYDSLHYI